MLTQHQELIRLTNGRFVDVEKGGCFPPDVSLIVERGRILSMPGLPGEQDVQADAVIDLQGKTVIPGLFNTHCHLQFMQQDELGQKQIAKNLQDCVERGVTNVRDTLVFDLRLNRNWMGKITRGEILGPRIQQAVHVAPLGSTYAPKPGPMTNFTLSMIGLKLVDYKLPVAGVVVFRPGASQQEVRDAVDRAVDERGAAAIKFCDQPEHFMSYKPGAVVITGEQLTAAVDQAIKRGMPTTMHTVTAAGFRSGIKAGIGSMAHLPMDAELDEDDARLFMESRTYLEPTLAVAYFMCYSIKGSPLAGHPGIQRLDQLRAQTYRSMVSETWIPELLPTRLAMDAALMKGELKVYKIMDISEPFRYFARMVPKGGKNLKGLIKYGAASHLACGNDAGPANCSAADIRYELAMLDFMLNDDGELTITPAQLLRYATIQSAISLGMDNQFGSIKTGKVADLAVLDGDPLQDFHIIGKPVQALFMNGELVINKCGLEKSSAEIKALGF